MTQPIHCSIIIPAFNEAERIGRSLDRIQEYLAGQDYLSEVIVVDDGSSDRTGEIVRERPGSTLVELGENLGKGAAVRAGMLQATGANRIFSDADLSTPIEETERVLEGLKEYDVVIGSRALDRSMIKVHQPWYREQMGKVFNLLVQVVAVRGIRDTQCGFKGFSAEAAEAIFSRAKIDGFSFDVEALFLARRLGYSILEIPVEWHNDERSTLDPVTDSIGMFTELLRVRRVHRGGDRAIRSSSNP